MAMKAKKDKTIQERYSTIIYTEQVFGKMVLEAEKQGLIKLTRKQKNNMTGFIGVMTAKPTQQLLHSSDSTHGKLRLMISTGDHQSPLQQQHDSSARVNQMTIQMEVAERITKAQSKIMKNVSGEMYAYMMTLTRPNTHKGNLDKAYKTHRERVSKLMRALRDAVKNGNGVLLVGGTYLGGFVSHEVTVNHDLIEQAATHGIFHPHTHIIILSDSPLNVKATKEVLLDKWRALNTNLSLSKDAFDFKPCFDPSKGSNERDAQISAIKEAVKYTVKPETWNKLSETSNQYQVEVFAELYNAVKGKKLKQSHGVLETASNFLSVFEDFSNAMSFSIADEFPDLVTQLSEMVFDNSKSKHGGYNAFYKRELTADEIIYYNRGLIEDVLVSSGIEAEIEAFFDNYGSKMTADKQKIYSEVFQSFTFARTTKDLVDHLERCASIEQAKNNDLKAYDICLLRESVIQKGLTQTISGELVVRIDGNPHRNFVEREKEKYEKLFNSNVGSLTGANATIENHNVFADFMNKQGLDAYLNIKDEIDVNLFVDKHVRGNSTWNVGDYFGVRFFEDDWKNVK